EPSGVEEAREVGASTQRRGAQISLLARMAGGCRIRHKAEGTGTPRSQARL
ncbi:hypothetical protein AX17_002977, partial [Amanita inopinata Kibby_2008]